MSHTHLPLALHFLRFTGICLLQRTVVARSLSAAMHPLRAAWVRNILITQANWWIPGKQWAKGPNLRFYLQWCVHPRSAQHDCRFAPSVLTCAGMMWRRRERLRAVWEALAHPCALSHTEVRLKVGHQCPQECVAKLRLCGAACTGGVAWVLRVRGLWSRSMFPFHTPPWGEPPPGTPPPTSRPSCENRNLQ